MGRKLSNIKRLSAGLLTGAALCAAAVSADDTTGRIELPPGGFNAPAWDFTLHVPLDLTELRDEVQQIKLTCRATECHGQSCLVPALHAVPHATRLVPVNAATHSINKTVALRFNADKGKSADHYKGYSCSVTIPGDGQDHIPQILDQQGGNAQLSTTPAYAIFESGNWVVGGPLPQAGP